MLFLLFAGAVHIFMIDFLSKMRYDNNDSVYVRCFYEL